MPGARTARRSLISTVVAGALAAAGAIIAAPPGAAVAPEPCVVGPVLSDNFECTLAAGATMTVLLKGGNGGAGGNGGTGGIGGWGVDGTSALAGGPGGTGGSGGLGGSGAKLSTSYTNTTASTVTLTFDIGADGDDGLNGDSGADGAPTSLPGTVTPAANGDTGGSGNGGDAGNGGDPSRILVSSTAVVTALAGDGGNGGAGGAGGEGGQGVGSPRPGSPGSSGAAGTNGSNAAGGNEVTTSSEAAFIEIVSIQLPAPPAPPAPSAPSITITLNPNSGTCAVSSLVGAQGTITAFPSASSCTRPGYTLIGWQTVNGGVTYAPGVTIELLTNNTFNAVWTPVQTPGTGGTTPPVATELVLVKWRIVRGERPELLSGDPAGLSGQRAVFTLNTKDPSKVTARDIAQTQALSVRYGGIYGGVIQSNDWKKPRIVAAYRR